MLAVACKEVDCFQSHCSVVVGVAVAVFVPEDFYSAGSHAPASVVFYKVVHAKVGVFWKAEFP